jgi:putative two-component system response regulator
MKKTIFVVDDNETNLTIAKEVLKDQYRVITLPSAAKMFEFLQRITPDLILLDIEMPVMDGFEALMLLKKEQKNAEIPVIFLTALMDVAVEVRGFQLGVVDFITKPFSPPVLTNRIKTHLDIDELIRERTEQLHQKTVQLENLQNAIIFGFADLVESRDENTGGHVERTSIYVKLLADALWERNVYKEELEKLDLSLFVSSARLHDVGKIAISDMILNKPDRLTETEYDIMKTHAYEGERAIEQIASRTSNIEFLTNALLFAGSHHERWDGKGYPRGLAGTNIPIQGRMMAIADVYDALVSERPYKNASSSDEATRIIMENAGTQFDPLIAEVFYEIKDKFEAVVTADNAVFDT